MSETLIASQDFRFDGMWWSASRVAWYNRPFACPVNGDFLIDRLWNIPRELDRITLSVYRSYGPSRWLAKVIKQDDQMRCLLHSGDVVDIVRLRTVAGRALREHEGQRVYLGCEYYEPTSD